MEIEKFSMNYYNDVINLWRNAGISVGSSDTFEEVKIMINKNPELFLIGKSKNHVIAVVMGAFDGRRGYVHHLAVDPKYQKKGYGKGIMDELMKKFRKMGVHKVHLFIEKYNKKTVDFYLKLGWEIRDDLIMMSIVPDKNLYKREI
ncbi:MAG: GNAT family N-acetyltransferase [Candidatus Thorarchaeota archaeon]